jgi:ATP/maltotriose-dependent transcriptional regulator MalT
VTALINELAGAARDDQVLLVLDDYHVIEAGPVVEARGLVHEAIEHALAASEVAWADRMIERNFDGLLERAEGAMVDLWVAALPAELVRSRPRLRLAQAVWVILSGRLAQAERLLADAERALEGGGDDPGEPPEKASLLANVPAMIALLGAGIARRRGDSERMDALVQQARAHLSADDRELRPLVGLYLAVADQLRGRTAKAERSLAGAVADQHTAGGRYLAVSIACDLRKVRQAQGELDGAQRAYEQALEIVTEAGLPLPLTGMAYLGMAEVLYERDDLDAAARYATEAIAVCAACPVRVECLEFALRHSSGFGGHGVWDGMVEADRRSLRLMWLEGSTAGQCLRAFPAAGHTATGGRGPRTEARATGDGDAARAQVAAVPDPCARRAR